MGIRKEHPGLKNKENDENSGPTTTVFVGNISEKASDMLIRQLLAVSGFCPLVVILQITLNYLMILHTYTPKPKC